MFKQYLCPLFLLAACSGAPLVAAAQAQAASMLPSRPPQIAEVPEPVLAWGADAPGVQQAGVRRITDGALGCAQILAEVQGLEKALAEQQAGAVVAQQAADEARNAMMAQSMGRGGMQRGAGMASSLLGMIPGVGMVAGLAGGMAAQADMSARMSDIQDNTSKMMAAQQKALDLQQSMASSQGRHDHLVDLFLRKNCSLRPR